LKTVLEANNMPTNRLVINTRVTTYVLIKNRKALLISLLRHDFLQRDFQFDGILTINATPLIQFD